MGGLGVAVIVVFVCDVDDESEDNGLLLVVGWSLFVVFSSVVVSKDVFDGTGAAVDVLSFVVTGIKGVFDVVIDALLDVPSSIVTVVWEAPGVSDVEPGTVVVVDPVEDGEFALEECAVSDVVEVVVVVVTGLDMLLSIKVDVSVSVFVEDDTGVSSELDAVFFVVVGISIVVVSFCIFVVVSDVSVELVCVVVVVVVGAPVVFIFVTDEL